MESDDAVQSNPSSHANNLDREREIDGGSANSIALTSRSRASKAIGFQHNPSHALIV